jgi:hypothetical protein
MADFRSLRVASSSAQYGCISRLPMRALQFIFGFSRAYRLNPNEADWTLTSEIVRKLKNAV